MTPEAVFSMRSLVAAAIALVCVSRNGSRAVLFLAAAAGVFALRDAFFGAFHLAPLLLAGDLVGAAAYLAWAFLTRWDRARLLPRRLATLLLCAGWGAAVYLLGYGSWIVLFLVQPLVYVYGLAAALVIDRDRDRARLAREASLVALVDLLERTIDSFAPLAEREDRPSGEIAGKTAAFVRELLGADGAGVLVVESDIDDTLRVLGSSGEFSLDSIGARVDGGEDRLVRVGPGSPIRDLMWGGRVQKQTVPLASGEGATVVTAPIRSGRKLYGAVAAIGVGLSGERLDERFRRFGELADHFSAIVNGIRGYSETVERVGLDHGLKAAAEAQRLILPRSLPTAPHIVVAGSCVSAPGASRDYLDGMGSKDGTVVFAVADVAGKRPASAMTLPTIRAVLCLACGLGVGAETIVEWLNFVLARRPELELLASVAVGRFDPGSMTVEVAGGGTVSILRFDQRRISVEQVEIVDPPLGIDRRSRFAARRLPVGVGDIVVLCTDGLVEAVNRKKRQYGTGSLKDLVLASSQLSAPDLVSRIRSDVEAFAGGSEQSDDMSVVVAKIV